MQLLLLTYMEGRMQSTGRAVPQAIAYKTTDYSILYLGEVRRLYRAFKQECPTGIVDEETFKEVYDKIFPLGDSSHYAHLVFLSIDR